MGDSVSIKEGPLEGFTGVVEAIDPENGTVQVKVSLFGRDTPAELELSKVQPV